MILAFIMETRESEVILILGFFSGVGPGLIYVKVKVKSSQSHRHDVISPTCSYLI